jgi:hypothetical protein
MTSPESEALSLPMAMADLTLASWETVTRRMLLISQNQCSQDEYERMVSEKAQAAMATALTLMFSYGQASVVSLMGPWLSRANANVNRLRKAEDIQSDARGNPAATRNHLNGEQRTNELKDGQFCSEPRGR